MTDDVRRDYEALAARAITMVDATEGVPRMIHVEDAYEVCTLLTGLALAVKARPCNDPWHNDVSDHEALKAQIAEGIADYVEQHQRYESLSKREVVIAAVRVLTDDIGAAQSFVRAIGLDIDLYLRTTGCSSPYHCACGCGAHMGCFIYDDEPVDSGRSTGAS
jgi:hypothetical protein